jgi:hypothetical protein
MPMGSGAYLVVIVYLDRQDLHQHGGKPQSAELQESWFILKRTRGVLRMGPSEPAQNCLMLGSA